MEMTPPNLAVAVSQVNMASRLSIGNASFYESF